jgi:hypothetical protein
MATSVVADLTRIVPTVVQIEVEGITPLITNNFSEKIKTQIREAQAGKKAPKAPKDPAALYEGAKYLLPDGSYGFPAAGFKGACVSAGRFFNGITMTALRQGIFVHGEGPNQLVRLTGFTDEPIMREDAVRNATGVVDLRYRPMFENWGATIKVEFISSILSLDSVLSIVDAAGIGGIGEWRPTAPKSNGDYGRFRTVEGGVSILDEEEAAE